MTSDSQGGGYYSADDVRKEASGRWADVLAMCGVNTQLLNPRHGPCPGCGGRDRFRFDDRDGTGSFICSQGGGDLLNGDGIALLAHIRNCEWKDAVRELGQALGLSARAGGSGQPTMAGVAKEPRREQKRTVELDMEKVESFIRPVPPVDYKYLARRSPIDPANMTPEEFLGHLYSPGERLMVFTTYFSQGDYMVVPGKGSYRLSPDKGVQAVPSKLPPGSKEGVGWMVQPVSGKWHIGQNGKWGRRSELSVESWRYMVLESDVLDEALWLRVLVNLPLPIAAIYTSGGRSVHALVLTPAGNKLDWDVLKNIVKKVVCPLGADPGALSAVRLSRLPGCLRGQNKQRLLYLNPNPPEMEIRLMPEVIA